MPRPRNIHSLYEMAVTSGSITSGSITPWPDGARFAKVTWQRETGADGLVHPGKFVPVELMEKDAKLYNKTEGWGWGLWRGLDLNPYGASAAFVTWAQREDPHWFGARIPPALLSVEFVEIPSSDRPI